MTHNTKNLKRVKSFGDGFGLLEGTLQGRKVYCIGVTGDRTILNKVSFVKRFLLACLLLR
jgi:hypothetical protein